MSFIIPITGFLYISPDPEMFSWPMMMCPFNPFPRSRLLDVQRCPSFCYSSKTSPKRNLIRIRSDAETKAKTPKKMDRLRKTLSLQIAQSSNPKDFGVSMEDEHRPKSLSLSPRERLRWPSVGRHRRNQACSKEIVREEIHAFHTALRWIWRTFRETNLGETWRGMIWRLYFYRSKSL